MSRIDGLCADSCFEAPSNETYKQLAGFAKCPTNIDCGHDRVVDMDHEESRTIEIKGVTTGGLCVYSIRMKKQSTVDKSV